MYEIEFSDEALQDLESLKKNEQNEVLDYIDTNLRYEPAVETRNRKRLRPTKPLNGNCELASLESSMMFMRKLKLSPSKQSD